MVSVEKNLSFSPESIDGKLAVLWHKFNILNQDLSKRKRDDEGKFTKHG